MSGQVGADASIRQNSKTDTSLFVKNLWEIIKEEALAESPPPE